MNGGVFISKGSMRREGKRWDRDREVSCRYTQSAGRVARRNGPASFEADDETCPQRCTFSFRPAITCIGSTGWHSLSDRGAHNATAWATWLSVLSAR